MEQNNQSNIFDTPEKKGILDYMSAVGRLPKAKSLGGLTEQYLGNLMNADYKTATDFWRSVEEGAGLLDQSLNPRGANKTPLTGFKLARSGLEAGISGATSLFNPITAGIQTASQRASDSSAVQDFSSSKPVSYVLDKANQVQAAISQIAQSNPELARNVKDLVSISLIAVMSTPKMGKTLQTEIKNPFAKASGTQTPQVPVEALGEAFKKGGDVHNTMKTFDSFVDQAQRAAEMHNKNVMLANQIKNTKMVEAGTKVKSMPELQEMTSPVPAAMDVPSKLMIYKDLAKKIYTPEAAQQIVSEAKNYFMNAGHPELAAAFIKAVNINNLTPQAVIEAGNSVIEAASSAGLGSAFAPGVAASLMEQGGGSEEAELPEGDSFFSIPQAEAATGDGSESLPPTGTPLEMFYTPPPEASEDRKGSGDTPYGLSYRNDNKKVFTTPSGLQYAVVKVDKLNPTKGSSYAPSKPTVIIQPLADSYDNLDELRATDPNLTRISWPPLRGRRLEDAHFKHFRGEEILADFKNRPEAKEFRRFIWNLPQNREDVLPEETQP